MSASSPDPTSPDDQPDPEQLAEDAEDLAALRDRADEPAIPLESFLSELGAEESAGSDDSDAGSHR